MSTRGTSGKRRVSPHIAKQVWDHVPQPGRPYWDTRAVLRETRRCDCLQRACERFGVRAVRDLGAGMYARAWLLSNGHVLKLTCETEAVALATRLMDLQPRGLALRFVRTFHAHALGECTVNCGPVWALVQERLVPYKTDGMPRAVWPNGIEQAKPVARDARGRFSSKDARTAHWDSIRNSMRDAGVHYMKDLHPGNVMWRLTATGPELVVSDLGLYCTRELHEWSGRGDAPDPWQPRTPWVPQLRRALAKALVA